MRRRDKSSSKAVKTRRQKASLHRSATKTVRRHSAVFVDLQDQLDRRTRELNEALEQQTATSEVLKVISRSAVDLETVLDTLVQTVARLCRADQVYMFHLRHDLWHLVADYGLSAAAREFFQTHPFTPGRGSTSGRAALERRAVLIPDVLQDPEYTLSEGQVNAGYRTTLGIPLIREHKLIGVYSLARTRVEPFTDKEVELAATFADQAVIAIENARLFEELRESLQQQTATADVLRVISSSPGELEPVFEALLENATRICEARFGNMSLYNGETFQNVALHNPPDGYSERGLSEVIRPHAESGLAYVARTKQIAHIDDIRTQPPYREGDPAVVLLADAAGARTLLIVPMLKENTLIGTIAIYRQEVRPFTDKQIELVKNFAAQAVIAIENARLLSELRESLQQQTATADVLKVISRSTGDLKPVFESILANATRICEAKFGALFLTEGDAFQAVALHGAPEYAEARRREPTIRPGPGTSLNRAASTKQPVQIADIRAEPAYTNDPQRFAILDLAGARTIIAVPMLKDDVLVGIINIYRTEVRPFIDKQIELLKNFAAQAVIAIENARLLNELRESLQQQTATADVLKVISRSTFDLKAVLTNLVETAVRVCEADIGNIARPIDGETYKIEANYGQSTALYEELARQTLKIGKGSVIGRTALSRAPVHILDAQTDPDYELRAAREIGDYHTMLGVPMVREGNIIGVFGLARNTVRAFTEKQIELVTTFADQAVIAIENVRLFESVEARTRELAQSLDNLRTTQDRLVQTEKLASLGQLTAGIAHEIKNPLNFVNNFSGVSAELIDELQNVLSGLTVDQQARSEINELTDTLRSNLDKVVQHGKRADAIVKNMLLHSREGSGEHRVVDINALVEESLNLAYHGARAEKQGFNITMERSLDPAAGEVDLFPQDITRVLLNLISNGFYAATKRKTQAGHDGYEPTLSASTRSLGDQVEIRIRDNGTGIPPEVKEKMFNPFFTTKPAGEGTGLGLSISHDIIVKQHGGAIEVDTEPGEYTEFRIVLPRKSAIVGKIGGVG